MLKTRLTKIKPPITPPTIAAMLDWLAKETKGKCQ